MIMLMEEPLLNLRRISSLNSKVSMLVKRVMARNQMMIKARMMMMIIDQTMRGVVIKTGKMMMKDLIRLNEFILS